VTEVVNTLTSALPSEPGDRALVLPAGETAPQEIRLELNDVAAAKQIDTALNAVEEILAE
jgi:hypothetical protein